MFARARNVKNQIEGAPLWLLAANVFTVSSLIFAQPILDLLGRFPEFLVANDLSRSDVYLLALSLSAIVPLILFIPILISTPLGRRTRSYVQTGLIFVLAGIIIVRFLSGVVALPGFAVLGLGAVLASGIAATYLYNSKLSSTLGWLTPIVIVFPVMFFLNSNVRDFMRPHAASAIPAATDVQPFPNQPPIVMIVWDELPLVDLLDPQGGIDAKRFPNFHALVNDATWYENATTVWITTFGALPAILTGSHPISLLPMYKSYPKNLFTLIEGRYTLNAFESITQLQRPADDGDSEQSTNERMSRWRMLSEDIGLILLHLHLPLDLTRNLPSIEGQWGGFVLREGAPRDEDTNLPNSIPPREATASHDDEAPATSGATEPATEPGPPVATIRGEDMTKEQQQEFLNAMTDEELAAFKKSLAQIISDDARKAMAESLSPEERRRRAQQAYEIKARFAENWAEALEQQRRLMSKHFNESRSEFFERFVASIDGKPRNTLHFAHLLLPHPPAIYLPSGRIHTPPSEYRSPNSDRSELYPRWASTQDELDNEHHRLRLQTAFADRLLGNLIAELKRLELYDDALIVICADHGGSFLEGDSRRMPSPKSFGDVAFVPVIIKYPNQQAPERIADNVETIDILPTVYDVLDADLGWRFQGRSLIDASTPPRAIKVLPPDRQQIDKTEYSAEEYLKYREEAHRRIVETFSLDDPRSDIFHYGKALPFIGESVSAVEPYIAPGTATSADVDRLVNIDTTADDAYPRVQGTVQGTGPDGDDFHVAVVINQRVAAVVPVYPSGPDLLFEAILAEDILVNGKNDVSLLLLDLRTYQ